MPTLNAEQQSALDKMVAYATAHKEKKCAPAYKDKDGFSMGDESPIEHTKPFIFTGLAGTGKTTVVGDFINVLINEHGYVPGRIGVCAFTGKATSVLNKKLGEKCPVVAKTIHRLIYHIPSDRADMISNKIDMIEAEIDRRKGAVFVSGAPEFASFSMDALRDERKKFMEELKMVLGGKGRVTFTRQSPAEVHTNYDLIIVDEASMVNEAMADHLLDTGLPIIFVGDSNQLPPVKEDFGVDLRHPDAKLTTIMRQQGDSDIITVAHDILKQKKLPPVVEGLVGVTRTKSSNPLNFFPTKDIAYAPQFVVHYNADRHRINKVIRQHVLGVTGPDYMPLKGEKIMLDANLPEKRLMKGDILIVKDYVTEGPIINEAPDKPLSRWRAAVDQIAEIDYTATLLVEDVYGNEHEMKFFLNDLMMSMGHSAALDTRNDKDFREIKYKRQGGIDVMFPYAITCYKAQGSEWPRVVVQNYGNNLNGLYLPYIYTAVTRARDELTIVG